VKNRFHHSGSRYSEVGSDECKLVVMSDRAYRSIICEACSEIKTETGGILLGRAIEGVWFIVEVIDPGLNVTLRPELFSYDARYVNHLIPKISKLYDYSLDIIGIWHRHPGSMDYFSSIDDDSHDKLIHEDLKKTIISMLVNFDPKFRMTMYYVDNNVNYHNTELLIGDDQMIPELLALANVNDLFSRFNLLDKSPICYSKSKEFVEKSEDSDSSCGQPFSDDPSIMDDSPSTSSDNLADTKCVDTDVTASDNGGINAKKDIKFKLKKIWGNRNER